MEDQMHGSGEVVPRRHSGKDQSRIMSWGFAWVCKVSERAADGFLYACGGGFFSCPVGLGFECDFFRFRFLLFLEEAVVEPLAAPP